MGVEKAHEMPEVPAKKVLGCHEGLASGKKNGFCGLVDDVEERIRKVCLVNELNGSLEEINEAGQSMTMTTWMTRTDSVSDDETSR